MSTLPVSTLLREAAYFIDGKWLKAANTFPVNNPATLSVLGQAAECGAEETRLAVEAAEKALPAWRGLTAKARADIMHRWFDLIEQHRNDLALLMTLEQGKPLAEALGEVDYGNAFISWFAEEGRRIYGDIIPSNKPNQRIMVIKQSVGVVASITPWNFPLAMITRKCAPALAAGCTLVIKPAKETPFTALALVDLAERAGFPAGVINLITGAPEAIGKVLTEHPSVKKLSFTGSTAVGKLLMKQCADTLKKLSLELGGNAPFIVFEDADLDLSVKGAMASKFRNSGQTCVCANRIYVQDSIYDRFAEKLKDAVKALKVGNGWEVGMQQGPLINAKGLEKVERHVKDALSKGAKILCGGKKLENHFFEPTVLTEIKDTMQIASEETFGPVAPLFRFQTEEEVIERANATPFGLAAYFYSQNYQRIFRVAEKLESGMIGINEGIISTEVAPFGGVKESGFGREGSKYGIEEYLEIKYLCLA